MQRLVEHPRVTRMILGMHEGLAQLCDEMHEKEEAGMLDPVGLAHLNQYREMYRRRVGVDVIERAELLRAANEAIQRQV